MKHKDKVKLARKLTPHPEEGRGIFGSDAWNRHRLQIAARVDRIQGMQHRIALEKKAKRALEAARAVAV